MAEQETAQARDDEQQIEDLPTREEESEDVKAGAICNGVSVLAWARVDGQS